MWIDDLHEKVVWLDVSVDEVFAVNKLDSWNELVGEEENRFEAKPAGTKVEEVFQTGAQ